MWNNPWRIVTVVCGICLSVVGWFLYGFDGIMAGLMATPFGVVCCWLFFRVVLFFGWPFVWLFNRTSKRGAPLSEFNPEIHEFSGDLKANGRSGAVVGSKAPADLPQGTELEQYIRNELPLSSARMSKPDETLPPSVAPKNRDELVTWAAVMTRRADEIDLKLKSTGKPTIEMNADMADVRRNVGALANPDGHPGLRQHAGARAEAILRKIEAALTT